MIRVRSCKIALVASVALFATLVVFNNITDYGANFKFVQHVLMMDTIFPDSRQTWRAVGSPLLHHAAYIAILCWAGAAALFKTVHEDATAFERAKGLYCYACCFAIPSSALPRRGLGTRALHQRSGRQAEVREDLGNHGGTFDACPEPVEGAAMICKVLPLLKGTGQCLGGVRSPSPGEDHGQGLTARPL